MPAGAGPAPTLVWSPHPLLAQAGRRVLYGEFLPGESIAAYLERMGVRLRGAPHVLQVNGVTVPAHWWRHVRPKPGTLITLRARVEGGGDGGKNPIAAVLSIVLLVVAPALEGMVAPMLGVTTQVAGALITFVGSMIINSLFPPPRPTLSQLNGRSGEQVSPTYSLAGGSNQARPYAPLPLVFGTHRVFPDYGARYYTEFEGEDQYLYQVFHFGLADVELTDFRIGNTPIASFQGVEIQVSGDDGRLTLFPGNVDTVAGGSLTAAAGWVTRTSSADALALAVEITGQLYYVGNAGTEARSVTLDVEYRKVGEATWLPFVYSDQAISHSDYWSAGHWENWEWGAQWVQVNYGSTDPAEHTQGQAYDAYGNTWRLRPYAERGNDPAPPQVTYQTVPQAIITSASRKPLRRSYKLTVPRGQYEVRVRRATADETDERAVSDITWSQLRTYQPDEADYSGQKRVAVKIKASGQLQGQLEQFSAVAAARVPVWLAQTGTWATRVSANPAWQLIWFLRGKKIGARRAFGALLPDARIDLEALKEWGAWCDAKGLGFNAVIDAQMSCEEVAAHIARMGRATRSVARGRHGVVWNAGGQPEVAVFGLGNIRRNTFSVEYASRPLADEIVARYVDPEHDWQQLEVRATVPGVTDPVNPATVDLFGCTSREQAGREANLLAAEHAYHPRRVAWETDAEGLVVSRGDVVSLSHDLTQWGYSGRLVAGDGTTVTLDRAVPFTPGESHYLKVVFPNGWFDVLAVQYQAGEATVLTLTEAWPAQDGAGNPLTTPSADPDHPPWDYKYCFAPQATPGKKLKIESVQPRGPRAVRIVAIDEVDAYYAAENNGYQFSPPAGVAEFPVLSNLQVAETLIRAGAGFAVRLTLTWDTAGPYESARVRLGLNGAPLEDAGATFARRHEILVPETGTAQIEVTGFSPRGKWGAASRLTLAHTLVGKGYPPADVTGFAAAVATGGVRLTWDAVADADLDEYEIRQGGSWDAGAVVARARVNSYLHPQFPFGTTTFWVRARDTSGNLSQGAASAAVTIGAPAAPTVSGEFVGEQLRLSWSVPVADLPIEAYELRHGASWDAGVGLGTVAGTTFSARADFGGSRTYWVAAKDIAGRTGAAGALTVSVTAPSAVSVTPQVIDNNVLLRWSAAGGTLPVDRYELRRGASFAAATVIGTLYARFATVFEDSAGTFNYWVVAIDSAGNMGTPASVSVRVNAPPDYVLYSDFNSALDGPRNNALPEGGALLLPVNATETFAEHFTAAGWTTPQNQIDAGYPYYLQPSPAAAWYEETIDYGAAMPSTMITVTLTSEALYGSVTATPTISVKLAAGDPWTDYPGVSQVYVGNFRYVKVRWDFAAAGGDDLLRVTGMNVKLNVKLRNDAGSGTANAADAGGTEVNFNVAFVDVAAISVTPAGTAARYAIYDFTDVPYPTVFKVLLFDALGNRVSGPFSWTARGV